MRSSVWRRGEIKRLIILMPPRNLKSICASVAFPAWLLGRDPTRKIICVSYTTELAAKHARDCRAVMNAAWYQSLFPSTRIDPAKSAETEFMTTETRVPARHLDRRHPHRPRRRHSHHRRPDEAR